MKSRLAALLMLLALLVSGCASSSNPIPTPSDAMLERDRYLVDPRIGYEPASPALTKRFDRAIGFLNQGRTDEAERRFAEMVRTTPVYRPALLAQARLAYDKADYDAALQLVERSEDGIEPFTAAEIYRAEIAIAQGNRDLAYEIYKKLSALPDAPATVGERHQELQKQVFEDLFLKGSQQSGEASIDSLRKALTIRDSEPARILLAQRLLEASRFEESREVISPLLTSRADREDVQAIAAELDLSRGEYQSAITQFERLARKHPDLYGARLRDAKERFNAANMPPQYRKAYESPSISRADLAVLIYWKLSSVRFASNLSQPPIAVDVTYLPGREELIRSMALGIFSVDPITRTVEPNRTVSPQSFQRIVTRLITLRGVPSCAASLSADLGETARAQQTLDLCGVDLSALRVADAAVSGRVAAEVLDRVERVLASTK